MTEEKGERGRFLNFARWFAAAPLRSRRIPPHDVDEPIGECADLVDRRVDPPGEVRIISILRADDDARMSGHRSVEPLEVLVMDGEHAADGFRRRWRFVRPALARKSADCVTSLTVVEGEFFCTEAMPLSRAARWMLRVVSRNFVCRALRGLLHMTRAHTCTPR